MPHENKALVHKLECRVMHYDWGAAHANSLVAELARSSDSIAIQDPKAPIAELWMGAHPRASALLAEAPHPPLSLRQAIQDDPDHFLGPELTKAKVRQLPFLFKILEAARPLSIQAHPDKQRAAVLHRRDPEHYPDPNHKPELAVCLAEMEALVGFRRPEQIYTAIIAIPELASLCSKQGGIFGDYKPPRPELLSRHQKRNWIKHHYSNLMRASKREIQEAAHSYKFQLESLDRPPSRAEDQLFLRFLELFGDEDPGIFSVFFLNYVKLKPGQALYLGPNEPHAYLGGRIIECMADSDNVVRAGLTQKFTDTETLLDMLSYNFGPPPVQNPRQTQKDGDIRVGYRIPVPDFELYAMELPAGKSLELAELSRPNIFLLLEGELEAQFLDHWGKEQHRASWKRGDIFLTPADLADRQITLLLSNRNSPKPPKIFQAGVGHSFR